MKRQTKSTRSVVPVLLASELMAAVIANLVGPKCLADGLVPPGSMASQDRPFTVATGGPKKTQKYSAYAPPSSWGTPVQVGAHLGQAPFTITAKAVGSTAIVGEVEYWAGKNDKAKTKKQFTDSITIRTADVAGTVTVRFKGIPTGTAVDVSVK